jgi:hypothetical protein
MITAEAEEEDPDPDAAAAKTGVTEALTFESRESEPANAALTTNV